MPPMLITTVTLRSIDSEPLPAGYIFCFTTAQILGGFFLCTG